MKKKSLSRHSNTALNLTPHYKANLFDSGGPFANMTTAGLWDDSTKATLNNTGGEGSVSGVFAGIEGMLESGLQNAKLKSTYNIQRNIADNFGQALSNQNLNTNDQLMEAWDQYSPMSHISRKDIRGGSTLGRLWNTNMASIKGAEAGWNTGTGPIGAIIGGVVGLGTGIAGWVAGGRKASRLRDRINNEIDITNEFGYQNLANQQSNVEQKNLLRAEGNYVAYGGPLDKRLAGHQMQDIYGNGIPSANRFAGGGELYEDEDIIPEGKQDNIIMFGDDITPEQLEARNQHPGIFTPINFVDYSSPKDNKLAGGGNTNVFVTTEPVDEHKSSLESLMPLIMQAKQLREEKQQREAELARLNKEAELEKLKNETAKNYIAATQGEVLTTNSNTPTATPVIDLYYEDPSEELYQDLMSREGFLETPEIDKGNGKWTIGYGDQNEELNNYYLTHKDEKYTREQGRKQLEKTVSWVRNVLAKKIPNWKNLTGPQKDALTSYGYNTGPGTIINSKAFMNAIANENWEEVANNMNAGYNDANLPGLRKRRDFERLAFLYPSMSTYGIVPMEELQKSAEQLNNYAQSLSFGDGGNLFAYGTEDPYAAAGRRYKNARTALVNNGYSEGDATRLAKILATQAVLESGYKDNSDNNYGGHLDPRSRKRMHYNNEEDFWKAQIDTLSKKWPEWNKAQTLSDYYNTINHTDLGLDTLEKFNAYNKAHRGNEVYLYAPEWENKRYLDKLNSIYPRASKYYKEELVAPQFIRAQEPVNKEIPSWDNLHFGFGGNLFEEGGDVKDPKKPMLDLTLTKGTLLNNSTLPTQKDNTKIAVLQGEDAEKVLNAVKKEQERRTAVVEKEKKDAIKKGPHNFKAARKLEGFNQLPGYTSEPYVYTDEYNNSRTFIDKLFGIGKPAYPMYSGAGALEIFSPEPAKAAKVITTVDKIKELPGYQLKMLLKGNPLEKQISKTGTVSVNNIKALANKGSNVEKSVIDKVLAEKFAGQKAVDYNDFRKAVQEELITYKRTPNTNYEDYGLNRLGLRTGNHTDARILNDDINRLQKVLETGKYPNGDILTEALRAEETAELDRLLALREANNNIKTNTFTFSSDRIPVGNAKHYDTNTLGHSRTFTNNKEPEILHVMESQSDWAQSKANKKRTYTWFLQQKNYVKNEETEIARIEENLKKGLRPDGTKIEHAYETRDIQEIIDNMKEVVNVRKSKIADFDMHLNPEKYPQETYLRNNYTTKQLQENLKYAAEKGYTKMRYPTRETAANIEGYPSRIQYTDASGNIVAERDALTYGKEADAKLKDLRTKISKWNAELDDLEFQASVNPNSMTAANNKRYHELNGNILNAESEINEIETLSEYVALKPGITKKEVFDYEDILKKYSDFPKQFKKLFKNQDVRNVTDTKGNSWYEVDVPKDYLNIEWPFKYGGKLKKH